MLFIQYDHMIKAIPSYILRKAPRIFGPESEFWVASVYGDKWRAVVEGQDSQEPDLIVSWTA